MTIELQRVSVIDPELVFGKQSRVCSAIARKDILYMARYILPTNKFYHEYHDNSRFRDNLKVRGAATRGLIVIVPWFSRFFYRDIHIDNDCLSHFQGDKGAWNSQSGEKELKRNIQV